MSVLEREHGDYRGGAGVVHVLHGTIRTYSGRTFDLLEPDVDMIERSDIAHALAHVCRFAGHTREMYSVAQHSVLVSRMVPRADALWGLLHDASEAFLGDVTRPLKQLIQGYTAIEERVMRCVAQKWGLDWPMPASVAEADDLILSAEFCDVCHRYDQERPDCELVPVISPWTPAQSRSEFLGRLWELERGIIR